MVDRHQRDQDKPIDVDNAADHRPDDAGAPAWQSESQDGKSGDQNPAAKQPPTSRIHK